MNRNLPQKYKQNVINKLIRKIKKFFAKNEKEKIYIKQQIHENNMLKDLKVDISLKNNTEYEKKDFMDKLIEHPELLETFTNDRLEKILQYYLDENEKKRELLKKMD